MKSNIMKKMFFKNILLVNCLSAISFISEDYSFMDADALIAKTKANAEKVKAVNDEKAKWEPQVKNLTDQKNKSEADLKAATDNIKTLQSDLSKALDDAKNLSASKAESEKIAEQKLSDAKSEIQKITEEKNNLTKTYEEESKKLNDSISQLQNDLKAKEQEKTDLTTKIAAAEKSRKDYEAKIEAEKKASDKKFTSEKNKLNEAIKLKTKQLTDKNNELKKLKENYDAQQLKIQNSETHNYINIDILKNEVTSLKYDLRNMLDSAKKFEAEKNKQEIELIKKHEAEKKYLAEIILKTQNTERTYIKVIDDLNSKLKNNFDRQNQIIEEAKKLEIQYKSKVDSLLNDLKVARDAYVAVVESNKIAELKNLQTIDRLKSELQEAIKLNTLLVNKAKVTAQAKSQEDIADSQIEVKRLMRIDSLETALNEAISKNNMLLENSKKVITDSMKYNQASKDAEQKYLKTIDKLTADIEKSKSVNEILKTNPSYGKWIIKQNFFGKPLTLALDNIPFSYPKKKIVEGVNQKFREKNLSEKKSEKNFVLSGYVNNSYNNQQSGDNPQINKNFQQQLRGQNYNLSNNQQGNLDPKFNNSQAEYPTLSNRYANLQQQSGIKKKMKFNQNINRNEIISKIKKMQKIETKDEQLVNFAVDSILQAILKMTNENIEKTNASMNLIGAGHELPQKLDAIIDVVKEQFNPIILEKALKKISKQYQQKKSFTDESLKYIYGNEGNKLIYWKNK